MAVIVARAPLRVSLGGGGTDLPSYFEAHGGFVVAGAIDKYVYMLVNPSFQPLYRMKYSQTEEVDRVEDIVHPILREVLLRHWRGRPLEIASVADVPSGTGMGSSGSFTVCLLKALARAGSTLAPPAALAESACRIEIEVLGQPVGKQDQYVAAHGGIRTYTFHRDGTVTVEPLDLAPGTLTRLRHQMLLFFTGATRSASAVLAWQDRQSKAHDGAMTANLHRTKEMGYRFRDLLLSGDLEGYAELMHEHWVNKRGRSPGITDARIDHLYDVARKAGALGGKLVGAGGGGFLLVYTRQPDETRAAMEGEGAEEMPFTFESRGAVAREFG